MRWFALILTLFFAAAAPAVAQEAAGPSSSMTPTPDDRAKQWLSLVDDGNYADAYKQAGPTIRDRMNADAFGKRFGADRAPLGAMASRTLKTVKLTKTLPGMRDGQYATVQYDSSFAHKVTAVETVTLTSEKGGWSVVGYHVD